MLKVESKKILLFIWEISLSPRFTILYSSIKIRNFTSFVVVIVAIILKYLFICIMKNDIFNFRIYYTFFLYMQKINLLCRHQKIYEKNLNLNDLKFKNLLLFLSKVFLFSFNRIQQLKQKIIKIKILNFD